MKACREQPLVAVRAGDLSQSKCQVSGSGIGSSLSLYKSVAKKGRSYGEEDLFQSDVR